MGTTTNKGRKVLADFLATKTLKAMLLNAAYTPNKDHSFVSSISANELTGTGYTSGFGGSGRKTLASVTATQDDTNDVAILDAADLTWTAINAGTVAYVAIVEEVTNDAASPVYAILAVTPQVATNGGDWVCTFAATGIYRVV